MKGLTLYLGRKKVKKEDLFVSIRQVTAGRRQVQLIFSSTKKRRRDANSSLPARARRPLEREKKKIGEKSVRNRVGRQD